MKKLNKLVALLLAAVMVLGMMPAMTTHAHAHTAQTQGIEDYPALELGVEFEAVIEGTDHYVTFTPEMSTQYRFVALGDGDTVATLYDDQNNQLASSDDCYMHNHPSTRNFCINAVLEAGKTYVLKHNYYNSGTTGTYNVLVTHEHYYEGTVTVPNTCTTDGVMTYACACGEGDSYTEVIPAAHSYDDEGVCTVCGHVYLLTGECGENLTWEMDWNGNLTIKGTGDMYHYLISYGSDKYPAPWYDYREDVTTITVEEGCTSIGNYAFYYCQYATELTLPESLTALGSNSFSSCYGLTKVVLPDGITEIPDSCFYYCGALAEVEWPDALTTIGSNAFNSCSLGDLVIPEGVTSLGQYAFGGNSNLTKLTLPSTLTEVADYTFSRMWNVKDFIFKGNAPAFDGSQVFQYVTANAWYPLDNESWTDEVKQNYGGTITWKPMCSGSHTWNDPVTVEATCETGSYMTMTCSVCGWTEYSPENDDALGHDYQTEHYDGGCGNSSYDIVTCSRCDYYSTENYTWNEHDYIISHVDATCEIGGYDVYTCSNCGDIYETNYTSPLGHDVAEWSEPTEATCTEAGVKTGTCARCGETATEEVSPALGHEWDEENGIANDDGSVTYPCIRCDATYTTEGSALHLGDNQFTIEANAGSTTKTYTADQAGKLTITLNNLLYHNSYAWDNGWVTDYWQTLAIDWAFSEGFFNVYVNGENTAYTVEGYETAANIILNTVEVAAGDVITVEIAHTSSSWYNTDPIQFNVNLALEAAEEPQPGSHTLVLGDNEFTMAASCGEGPVYSWTADEDGTLTVAMTKLEMFLYTFWNEEPVKPHLEDGNITFQINGEKIKVDSTTVAVKAGDVVTVQIGNYISFDMKAIVNLAFEAGEAPHEHSFGEWTVTTEPTCTEKGEETRSCECGETETREIAALGHDYVAEVVEPTCTKSGYTLYTCSRCGHSYKDDPVEPEHKWDEGTVTAPTCTEMGYTTYTCLVCGEKYVDEASWTEALGHDYVNGECT
ncbi:MAG: leucine-rich repeat domain-containing protein, partial [Oscillospiraceae bacterium]|nr:leucine-rich repeat domain-containing protein [Oscillospiraceae bacterium]